MLTRKEKIQVILFLIVLAIGLYYGGRADYEYIQAGLVPW